MRLDKPKAWTSEEDGRLAAMYDGDKLGPMEVAMRLGRTASSVRGRLTKLRKEGLVGPARGRGGRRKRDEGADG